MTQYIWGLIWEEANFYFIDVLKLLLTTKNELFSTELLCVLRRLYLALKTYMILEGGSMGGGGMWRQYAQPPPKHCARKPHVYKGAIFSPL